MEEQKELQKLFRQQQEKYIYYLIALAATAIGFSVYKSSGLPLKWSQIPLGLSILCWGSSIFCGLRFVKYIISTLYANNAYFDILHGNNPKVGKNSENIEVASKSIKRAMEYNSDRAMKLGKWQEWLFYSGMISFIAWHILEMYFTRIKL